MNIKQMTPEDISLVVPMYLEYYNGYEGAVWTEETATRRIRQVLTMEGGYSLLLQQQGNIIGFAMGYLKQYDDVVGYTLEEILISPAEQGKGIGTRFLYELERRVKELGASMVEILAVNDEMHEHFYGKAHYKSATNLLPKTKWL